MTAEDPAVGKVAGERTLAIVQRARGLRSRQNGALATVLIATLGIAALGWYYAHLWRRPAFRSGTAYARLATVREELPLPSLGRIVAPAESTGSPSGAAASPSPSPNLTSAPPPAAAPLVATPIAVDVEPRTPAARDPAPAQRALAMQRRLSGTAFVASTGAETGSRSSGGERPTAGALASRLHPTLTTPVEAQRLPSLRLLLPKGSAIDCTLETAIDSSLPGFTTCVTATDTFGANGEVVLLERGTQLVGEVRDQVQSGMARVFVLWTEARTPDGIVVRLDSPGTDAIGRAGIGGRVNRHFWQRFGAAMLISVVDAGSQALAQSANRGCGALVVNPSGSEEVMTEALRGSVAIPPTVTVPQGTRVEVLVARDLDFRSVYTLRTAAGKAR